jgi:hypothetical protein
LPVPASQARSTKLSPLAWRDIRSITERSQSVRSFLPISSLVFKPPQCNSDQLNDFIPPVTLVPPSTHSNAQFSPSHQTLFSLVPVCSNHHLGICPVPKKAFRSLWAVRVRTICHLPKFISFTGEVVPFLFFPKTALPPILRPSRQLHGLRSNYPEKSCTLAARSRTWFSHPMTASNVQSSSLSHLQPRLSLTPQPKLPIHDISSRPVF